jgi:hypothetical protein
MNFESSQSRYFLSELNRSLPNARSTGDATAIQQALGISDPSMPRGTRQQVTNFLNGFTPSANAMQMDQQCRALPAPGPAMRPDAGSRTGCGWWYNPTGNSMGAYGSRRGPMSSTMLESQAGSGRWVWDVEEAQQLEGMKQAAALPTCADLAYSKYPNMGWCTSTNMGIVTDGAGNPMYPRAPGGDCVNGRIITNPQDSECTATPGGSAGGSSSGGPIPNSVASACGSGAQPLNAACLSAISSYSCPAGPIAASYGAGTYPGPSSSIASMSNYISQRGGLSLPSGLINDGNVSIEQAFSGMQALRTAAGAGDGSRTTMAASNLCYGTPFDPCALNPTDSGPFETTCIVQAATGMGYAASAGLFSNTSTMASLASAGQWQQVTSYLTGLKQQADGTASGITVSQQQSALPTVYGVSVQNPKRGCNYNGVQMLRYIGTDRVFVRMGFSHGHFLGRYLFKNGFPNGQLGFNEQTRDGGFQSEFQRYMAVFTPTVGGTFSLGINADGITSLSLMPGLSSPVSQAGGTNDSGTVISTPPTQLIPDQPYSIELNLLGSTSAFLTISPDGTTLSPLPAASLTLPQDHRLPIINLNFWEYPQVNGAGTNVNITDQYDIIPNFYGWNTSIAGLAGKNCLSILGPASGVFNHLTYSQGIRLCAIKSFTMMLNITSVNVQSGTTPSILSFWNQPGANGLSPPHPFIDQPPTTYYQRQNDFSITMDNSRIYPFGLDQSNPTFASAFLDNIGNGGSFAYTQGTWFHLAFVWDDDFTGYTIYKDGAHAARGFCPAYSSTLIMEQIRIGCDAHPEGQSWTGGISWCHMYDYRISSTIIQNDMNNTLLSMS